MPSTANGRDPLLSHRRGPPDFVRGAAVAATADHRQMQAAILIAHSSIQVQRASPLPSVLRDRARGVRAPSTAGKGVPAYPQRRRRAASCVSGQPAAADWMTS